MRKNQQLEDEELEGLLQYQSGSKRMSPSRQSIDERALGVGKERAQWAFFTFAAVFLTILIVKLVTNNVLQSLGNQSASSSSKPNFVFILADDVGYGILNNPAFPFTPFLSSIADQGIVMNNYYSQELCAPARAALLTGRLPASMGMQYGQIGPTDENGLPLDIMTLPQALKEQGNYKTYALGKWNLGHYHPDYLPTSRGFDYYLGYLTTQNTYWTKSMAEFRGVRDFMEADESGYRAYNGDDLDTYSTFLYRDHAINIIQRHAFDEQPMFLYVAVQAAHTPFEDLHTYLTGIPDEYMDSTTLLQAKNYTAGHHRQQYALAVSLLDGAIQSIYQALVDRGVAENTYFVFTSDNGGCPLDGGENFGLRGTKATLFEGGTRVDALLYHPQFTKSRVQYNGLMHISDWMPSLLSLAGLAPVKDMDGYDHVPAWRQAAQGKVAESPRASMLYNMYAEVEDVVFVDGVNATFAVRDSRYKLLFVPVVDEEDSEAIPEDGGNVTTSSFSSWFDARTDAVLEDDDERQNGPTCTPMNVMVESGAKFTFLLFDLMEDPAERNNLYGNPDYASIQESLLSLATQHRAQVRSQPARVSNTTTTAAFWEANGMLAQPWVFA